MGKLTEAEIQAAVARVNARGSLPEAIAEAEGDFGPGGLFSDGICGVDSAGLSAETAFSGYEAGNLTETEAETLAVMLDSASRKMARTKARIPGTGEYGYVWENPYEAVHDMCEGFYAIVPGEYGIYL
jgi:hypothetical protein